MLVVRADFIQFSLEFDITRAVTGETTQRLDSASIIAALDQPTWGLTSLLNVGGDIITMKVITSGRNSIPNARMAAQTNWIAIGIR